MDDTTRRLVYNALCSGAGFPDAGIILQSWRRPAFMYAIYSPDDNSLTFREDVYRDEISADLRAGKEVKVQGKTITQLYGISRAQNPYASGDDVPWSEIAASVTSVSFANKVRPYNTAYWFYHFTSLTSVDLTNLDLSLAENAKYMFGGCSSLESVDVSVLDFSHLTDIHGMFRDCTALTSVDLSGLDAKNVTDMSQLFYGCTALTSVNLSGFNTSKAEQMNHMFYKCPALTSIDVSSFDTSNATSMQSMFSYSAITSLDLRNFNTSKVESIAYMFSGCSALTSLDLSSFDTSSVTDMKYMFYGCKSLTSLDLSSFDTRNVTDMSYMFRDCETLATLDMSGFITSKVTTVSCMFYNCFALTAVDVSGFDTSNITDIRWMFYYCQKLTELDLTGFDTGKVTLMKSMFGGCESLTRLDLSSFDTQYVTDMSFMFYMCTALKSLDLSSFDTSKVENTSSMFRGCAALTTIFASSLWDMSALTSWSSMYVDCTSLVGGNGTVVNHNISYKTYSRIDTPSTPGYFTYKPSAFAVYSATDNSLTFYNNASGDYSSLTVGGTYKGKKVTNLYTDFDANEYAAQADLPWNGVVANIATVCFAGVIKPRSLLRWFSTCSALTKIENIGNLDTSKATSMKALFQGCSSLASLDLSNFDTSKVTDMSYMFRQCTALNSLDLSSFDTRNVTDMSYMFYKHSTLTSLDLSSFDTSKVTTMLCMFYSCAALAQLDVSSFKGSSLTSADAMFNGCSSLTAVDLAKFDTSNLTTMDSMFYGCSALRSLDLSSFDASKVTNMQSVFNKCYALTTLDLSSFNTSGVTNMNYLFYNCTSLEKIYVSYQWSIASVTKGAQVFDGCSKIVGGNGTAYSADHIDYTYARIDTSSTPGYFTAKTVSPEDWPADMPAVGTKLQDFTWEQISLISAAGLGPTYFNVGDTKSVYINGTVGTLSLSTTLYVYIIGFNHNGAANTIDFGTFKTANGTDVSIVDSVYNSMAVTGAKNFVPNHWGNQNSTYGQYQNNYGGWKGCDMRYDILGSTDKAPSGYGAMPTTSRVGYDASSTCATNPVANTLMAALPAELRAVMKPMTIYTDNKGGGANASANVTASVDYLPLAAEYEVNGVQSKANAYEKNMQAQYAYYAAGKSPKKYRHDSTSNDGAWYSRSTCGTTIWHWCYTSYLGAQYLSTGVSLGMAPIFRV